MVAMSPYMQEPCVKTVWKQNRLQRPYMSKNAWAKHNPDHPWPPHLGQILVLEGKASSFSCQLNTFLQSVAAPPRLGQRGYLGITRHLCQLHPVYIQLIDSPKWLVSIYIQNQPNNAKHTCHMKGFHTKLDRWLAFELKPQSCSKQNA